MTFLQMQSVYLKLRVEDHLEENFQQVLQDYHQELKLISIQIQHNRLVVKFHNHNNRKTVHLLLIVVY
jgi:hypothetical protein